QSEVQAKAEQKSDLIEVQQKYAKQYRVSVHQWSYGRLMANIHSSAVKAGIVIEESKQPMLNWYCDHSSSFLICLIQIV
ncbi:hypothetical protein, partial [uncultured Nostoc sp.]|uniref:hypothetical protein n=1 Tax=uncultured Nostoc sp. TaxID=340711 RepID=UPI0035CAD26E